LRAIDLPHAGDHVEDAEHASPASLTRRQTRGDAWALDLDTTDAGDTPGTPPFDRWAAGSGPMDARALAARRGESEFVDSVTRGSRPVDALSADTALQSADAVAMSFVSGTRGRSRPAAALRDRLPVALRGRWHVDPRAAIAAAMLALVAVLVACWHLWQAQPRQVAFVSGAAHDEDSPGDTSWHGRHGFSRERSEGDAEPTSLPDGGVPGAAMPGSDVSDTGPDAASSVGAPNGMATPGTVEIDVVGKVRAAGVVRLPTGARVADAIAAAGGALPGTDLTSIDLAQPVTDGEQIRVGLPPAPGTQQPAGGVTAPGAVPEAPPSGRGKAVLPPGTRISLSDATAAQLEELPDIGPAMAARIIAWRGAHGGFTSVDQLRQVSGIGPAKFAKLAPLVTP
jgi:competence protein ComEA